MRTYYVSSQDPALDRSNTSLQICPPPALCHALPAGSSLDPVPRPCLQNTGPADQELWMTEKVL